MAHFFYKSVKSTLWPVTGGTGGVRNDNISGFSGYLIILITSKKLSHLFRQIIPGQFMWFFRQFLRNSFNFGFCCQSYQVYLSPNSCPWFQIIALHLFYAG